MDGMVHRMIAKARQVARNVILIAKPPKYFTFLSCILGVLAVTPIAQGLSALPRVLLFFVSFAGLTYTGIYLINDIADVAKDRQHSLKNGRALASGVLTRAQATRLSLLLIFAGLASGYFVHPLLPAIECGFVLLNMAYSRKLKHLPYVDLFVNTITHPLRVVTGIVLFGQLAVGQLPVILAPAALYLATNALKRHLEISQGGPGARPVLRHYSEAGLQWTCILMGFVLSTLLVVAHTPLYRVLIVPDVAIYLFSVGGYWSQEGRWRRCVVYGLIQ
jgi:4-hydroxybenzoate polyprenyltransferase